MRAVLKNFNNPPSELLTNNLDEVIDLTNPLHKKKIRQYIYSHLSVKNKLLNIYCFKCAYCESFEPEPEIDHYRPKGGVTESATHLGYYWLCYEWSNLLPACHDCNKTLYKGNHFPIDVTYQTAPVLNGRIINLADNKLTSATLTTEVPLLLNPEFPGFDPFQFFKIDCIGTFKPFPNPGTLEFRKSEKTIEILGLNRTNLLLVIRKRRIKYYMKRIEIILYEYLWAHINTAQYEFLFLQILKEIKENCKLNKTNEYWFFWNYFLNNFKFFVSCYFKGRFSRGIFSTFDNLKTQI